MVELADLTNAARLKSELQTLDLALANFAAGGRIVSLNVAGPLPDPLPEPLPSIFGVPVSTIDIDYPPQMVTAITTALQQRRAAIAKDLADMGITGLDQPSAQGPQALKKGAK